jgi:uncharacterized membrane protein
MTIKQILQGRWMTHPLHPATVHMPLGVWLSSIAFDMTALVRPSGRLMQAADYANRFALGAALPSVLSGLADYVDIEEQQTFNWATAHMLLNGTAAGLAVAAWKFRSEETAARRPSAKLAATQAALLGVLLTSGYIGGLMTYEKGMRVVPLEPSEGQRGKPVLQRQVEKLKRAA